VLQPKFFAGDLCEGISSGKNNDTPELLVRKGLDMKRARRKKYSGGGGRRTNRAFFVSIIIFSRLKGWGKGKRVPRRGSTVKK